MLFMFGLVVGFFFPAPVFLINSYNFLKVYRNKKTTLNSELDPVRRLVQLIQELRYEYYSPNIHKSPEP